MVAAVTVFRSTEFPTTDRDALEIFIVTKLNPTVAALPVMHREGRYFLRDSGRSISANRAHHWLLARKNKLPVQLVQGRRLSSVAIQSIGDSDNDDDVEVSDAAIRAIAPLLPRMSTVGFQWLRYPSNDTDDQGGVIVWLCRGGEVIARLSRDWTEVEGARRIFRPGSLEEIMRIFRSTHGLGLFARPARRALR